ncbi:hypothetical protein BGW38_001844 [Lunasporangiospora selenospora]|uniref:Ferritin n=1 Tax=Lunasporangiospora selenospora TaxID=979761 RepID=A0A9P6FTM5_9FUNG|nr:hypothetical protein BGW38_001844 [Lunasporangiospora selenospora]
MALAKQNFSSLVEEGINHQISLEMAAAQNYRAISAFLGSDTVALPGLEKYFREQAEEEQKHAQYLIEYQNRRGGTVVIQTIPAPSSDWTSAKNAVESALQLEKDMNKNLLRMESTAEEQNDVQFASELRTFFLKEQVDSVATFSKLITQLNRVGGDGLGLQLLDQTILTQGIHAAIGSD